MAEQTRPKTRLRDAVMLLSAALMPVPWMVCNQVESHGLGTEWIAVMAGFAIVGAAFLLSWAAELAERDIPQAMAILMLALVSVLPEYAVDLHFAWAAGKDPSYAPYAVANMTGANRLLIGFGWAAVVLISCSKTKSTKLLIHPQQKLEIRFLVWATLFSFLIPLTGTINLFDAAVLLLLFLLYAVSAMRSESEEIQLVGPAAMIDRETSNRGRRLWSLGLFVFAAYGIFIAAEPFAESLVKIGLDWEIEEFLLIQWVAPLASESPEFIIAILFALRLRGSIGIGALISSKVNQWTLLVGAIPIAFALSSGTTNGLPLDERQTEEMLLTSAQSLFAAILIADLRFSRKEAILLLTLFLGQFLFTSTEVRYLFIGLYFLLSVGLLFQRERRRDFFEIVFSSPFPKRD